MIQAYFFDKNKFTEKNVQTFLLENSLKTIKISDNKYHYKIKLLSAKKLIQQGYNLNIHTTIGRFGNVVSEYKVCKASKPEVNTLCKFTFI